MVETIQVKDEFDAESLVLMGDKEFMVSYNTAKDQIKKRDFASWNEL